jgi:hypothetical protein
MDCRVKPGNDVGGNGGSDNWSMNRHTMNHAPIPSPPGDGNLVVAGGLLAMTKRSFDSNFKQQIHVHILAAGCARGLRVVVPRKQREQGMPDARCTRGLACKRQKENAHEHTGSAEALRHSLRNGFTAYFGLSPENRASLSPSSANSCSSAPGRADLPSARLDANH